MKKLCSIVMIFMLLSCVLTQAVAVELAVAQSKISSDLLSEFTTLGTSETALAYVEMQDVDHDAVMEEFACRYPEEYGAYVAAKYGSVSGETTQEQDELLQRAIELKRAVYREFYAERNQSLLDEYVDAEKQVYISEYAPMAILALDQSAAMRVARSDEVLSVAAVSWSSRIIVDSLFPEGLTSFEIIQHLDLSNQISRADYLRDTKNLTGNGVKIGILEASGVPDTTNVYLQNTSIAIRPGDEDVSAHATIDALILAAKSADGTMHGVAPNAQFYCARYIEPYVTNYNVHAKCFYEDIEWMISCGVNIINASLSLYIEEEDMGTYDAISQWVDHIATVHDVHFVSSGGNNNVPPLTIYVTPPAMAYNAIAVGGFWANGADDVAGFALTTRYSYAEKNTDRPEKPNLVANAYFGDYVDNNGISQPFDGTSFAAPQVTGVIAQLCCWDGNLKFRQNVVGAVLAASAAEKVDATCDENQAYTFASHITGSEQINDKEGAGILDARWAWGILANENYWNIIQNVPSEDDIFYERTVTINTNVHTLTRVAIFWTKNNTDFDHTTNELGSDNPPLTNFDLYVYDSAGELIESSTTTYSNFEIVQFVPQAPGIYRIVIKVVRESGDTSTPREYVGLAIW